MNLRILSRKYGYVDVRDAEKILTKCRVCGYDFVKYHPWGKNGEDASNDICVCCGVEFGHEDWIFEGIVEYRKKWIEKGAHWFDSKEKTDGWNLKDALAGLPEELFETNATNIQQSPKPEDVLSEEVLARIKSRCMVCGYNLEKERRLFASCPCCDVVFGKEDWRIAGILKYRRQWLSSNTKKKQACWNPEEAANVLPRELFSPEGA